jgi:Na+/alanine symporter
MLNGQTMVNFIFPNLVALFSLSGVIIKESRDYFQRVKNVIKSIFASKIKYLGLKNDKI